MHFPDELVYTKEHEWLKIENGSNIGIVGITDFAQSELGDIVYVEIETLNQGLERQAVFGTIEAVKTVSDLYMPLTGTIVEVNEKLQDQPELVNDDPYGDGWMVKIQIDEELPEGDLLSSGEYEKMIS